MPAGGRTVTRPNLAGTASTACEALKLHKLPISTDWDCKGNDKWESGEGIDIVEAMDDLISGVRHAEEPSQVDLPAEDGSVETFSTGAPPPPHYCVRPI